MRTRYPGTCAVCRSPVEAGKGEYDTKTRTLKCDPCAGTRPSADTKPLVQVTRQGNTVSFKPTSYLGGELFNKYRNAIAGTRFVSVSKTNTSPMDRAPDIISALSAAGFLVDVAPDLASTLQALRSKQQGLIISASERAGEIDRKLKERGLVLFPFQRVGIQWIAGRMGALLADEMGLGKTIQIVVALPEEAPVIVVCAAVAKGVWAREIARWRPDLHPVVLEGRASFRWPSKGEVVITNFDVLPRAPSEGLPPEKVQLTGEPLDGTVLVGDEVHAIKSSKSLRTQSFRAISERVRAKGGRVWLATGTPLLNKPPELWNILQAADIAREAFGSYNGFVQAFSGSPGEWGGIDWGEPKPEVADKIRRVCLRRMRTDVLPELPVKTWQQVPVDLASKQAKEIDKATDFILSLFPTAWEKLMSDEDPWEAESKASNPLTPNDIEGARQLMLETGKTNFEAISNGRKLLARAKIPAMLEFIAEFEEQDEPLVVFSAHREPIDLLAAREGWAVITGDTPAAERTRIENDFQAGKLKGVGGTIKAAGVAITLTRAHHALFVDREFTPGLNEQAEDRVCRISQTRGVVIHDLVANHPLDRILFEILGKKETIIEASVDAARITSEDAPPTILPDVDFEALARLAEEEVKALSEAERIANERRQKAEAEKLAYETELATAKKEGRVVAKPFLAPGRRGPENPREEWALRALITLNQLDPDMARSRNDVGFNGSDSGYGHVLGARLYDGLTAKEWQVAIALCTKYWRQVGRPPN
jgi:SWI/SNF-related matrix-associated actin-dependent regulator 1 of chromatin subfamily A